MALVSETDHLQLLCQQAKYLFLGTAHLQMQSSICRLGPACPQLLSLLPPPLLLLCNHLCSL